MAYFTADVKPTIAASKQHVAAFTAGDVLFDWTEVQIPKGTSRIIGAAVLVRPKGNATPTANPFGFFMVFSKTNTQTLGALNGVPDKVPSNDLLGLLEVESTSSYVHANLKTNIGMAGRASNTSTQANVLITPSQTGDNVGYDKFYVGGIANGAFDFRSINTVASTAAAGTTVVCDGSSFLNADHFLPGDILQSATTVGANAADTVMGTVASITNATTLELTTTSLDVFVDGAILYDQNPIRIILFLEQ